MEEEPAASHDFLDRLRRVSFILFLFFTDEITSRYTIIAGWLA